MAAGGPPKEHDIAEPHGPNVSGGHVASPDLANMSPYEAEVFQALLKPDDSYDENGVYWADMPLRKRISFVTKVERAEAKKELSSIWAMTKADPLSPLHYYFHNMVIPGAGLLLEGYVLFSISNVSSLLADAFPECWSDYTVCNPIWIDAITYLEIIGIICGQILVGLIGDWVGRRWGLIQDAVIMTIGLVMLTASWGVTLNGWVICYAWSLWFYSLGVGGEYPMTATSGMENAVGAGRVSTREDRLHRGRKVTSAFLMQGWGQFLNMAVLIILELIFHGGGNPPYGKTSTQWTYRVSFAIPAVGTLLLVYYRTYKMRYASKQLTISKKRYHVTGYDFESLKLTLSYFGPRLLATCGGWFCNDVFFYGNKLFQSEFIDILIPNNKSIMTSWLYTLLNTGVELCGYYCASFLVDNKLYGRKWMQIVGFMLCFILFIIPAFAYDYYTTNAHVHSFQAMYFLSSFFNQFGPNAITFLVAAEVFPTPIRATAHGVAAAVGKLGALMATIIFNYVDIRTKFYVVTWFGLAGALITYLFLPDTTGLDLKEQERRWTFIRAGREHEYHGVAINPKHLSLYENWKGISKNYDPELDYSQRIEELRNEWEESMARRAQLEKDHREDDDLDLEDWDSDMSSYFHRTKDTARDGITNPFTSPVIHGGDDQQKHHETLPSPMVANDTKEQEDSTLSRGIDGEKEE